MVYIQGQDLFLRFEAIDNPFEQDKTLVRQILDLLI
jgi:hypothetical protein